MDDVFNAADQFLAANPSETLVVRIKHEGGLIPEELTNLAPTPDFAATVRARLQGMGSRVYQGGDDNPMLRDIRGKIVVLYQDDIAVGIPWCDQSEGDCDGPLSIQDDYSLDSKSQLYEKWESIKEHAEAASHSIDETVYVNFLSAAGGFDWGTFPPGLNVRPYFVASGQTSWDMGVARQATGQFGAQWPDFPRAVSGEILYEGTNILMANALRHQQWRHLGLVYADFPGKELIQEIIQLNYNHTVSFWSVHTGKFALGGFYDAARLFADFFDLWFSGEFHLVNAGDGWVAFGLTLDRERYVTVNDAQNGTLYMSSTQIGDAQRFKMVRLGNGSHALQSKLNGKYVSLVTMYTPLAANQAGVFGNQEMFHIDLVE